MSADPEIWKKGINTQFSSTNQPDNPGRKKCKFKEYIDNKKIGNQDIIAILTTLADKSKKELKELVADETKPIILTGIAAALLSDMKNGRTSAVQLMLDRLIGKAKQYVEVSEGKTPVAEMTRQERKEEIKELLKKRNAD